MPSPHVRTTFLTLFGWKLNAGAAVETLRAEGMGITMLSNGDLRMSTSCELGALRLYLKNSPENVFVDLGLAKFFDLLLVSEDLGNEKPTRQVWVDACLHVGKKLGEIVHVGDELEW